MAENTDRLTAALADRYRIVEHLGEGGMANVYLAQDLKHDRKVAVKVLRPELAAVLGAERFVQEIKTTASLQHPHILPLFDSGTAGAPAAAAGQFLFYVMPYVEGETLRDKLNRETQLGIEEAVRIASEIADALDYAHRHGVIHRDIKPENILLHDGRPMVADFGIALAVSAAAGGRMTETGLSLGTPHYMSPEQATADRDLTNRSDIYSLGSVLYEMLTGEPPHMGTSAQQIIMKIVTEPAAPVTKLRKSVPPNIASATARSLEKLPADRFESAKAFCDALGDTAFVHTTAAHPAGSVPGPARRSWLTAAQPVLLVVALLLAAWGWLRPSEAPEVSRHRISMPSSMDAVVMVGAGAIAPDGSAFVYLDQVQGSAPHFVIKEQEHVDPAPLTGPVSNPGGAEFSPDGEWVAYVADGHVYRVSRSGGPATELAQQASPAGLTWLADGHLVYLANDTRRIMRVPEQGGVAEMVVDGLDVQRIFTQLSPLPDDRGFMMLARVPGSASVVPELWVYDNRSDTLNRLVADVASAWYANGGYLVVVRRDGNMQAAVFDLPSLTVAGPWIPVGDGIAISGPGAAARVSLNGTLWYAHAGQRTANLGNSELVWVDRSGEVSQIDRNWRFSPHVAGGIRLSPDDTQVAFEIVNAFGADVYVKQLPGDPARRISFGPGMSRRPTWSPDGESLLYVSGDGGDTVWEKEVEGQRDAELRVRRSRSVFEGIWSPDGEWLVYRTDDDAEADRGDIMAIRPGDSIPLAIARTEFEETAPSFSPDGRWIAYSSDQTGRKEVYVVPFPNVQDDFVQVSFNGGTEPAWGHNGRELFYTDEARILTVAEYSTNPSFRIRSRTPLFERGREYMWSDDHRMYDVTSDDQRFVMIRRLPSNDADMILVENFFTDVAHKVGN